MTTYIKITKYMSGDAIKEQINEIIEAGKLDENTRLFFAKSNCITMRDLASIHGYFDIVGDLDFDAENLLLKPKDSILRIVKNGKKLAV